MIDFPKIGKTVKISTLRRKVQRGEKASNRGYGE